MLKGDLFRRRRRCRLVRWLRLSSLFRSYPILLAVIVSFSVFIYLQFLLINYIFYYNFSKSNKTRLYPDRPLTLNVHSFNVCHPTQLNIEKLNRYYHKTFEREQQQQQQCILIENLNGGQWWHYVSHEFAEILTHLYSIGNQSNIIYRPLPKYSRIVLSTNFTQWFMTACGGDQLPLVVVLWDVNFKVWLTMKRQWHDITRKISFILFIDDLHYISDEMYQNRQFILDNVQEILSTYAYSIHNYYLNISLSKLTWFPHSASSLVLHQTKSAINVTAQKMMFVSGANMQPWYPCRFRAFQLCMRKNLVACLRHPGYGLLANHSRSAHGERYSDYMKKYVFGLGTCQSVHYAVAKLFEIPSNGLVLITTKDMEQILQQLGLIKNEHYLTINCTDLPILINEIKHIQTIPDDELLTIRQNGQQVVHERHLTIHRAQLLHVRIVAHALLAYRKQKRQLSSRESNDEEFESSSEFDDQDLWEWGRNC
ncbi:unnamed protein product [Didymodactylos carnosus]|uniref:Uncharacterized protein n=1 Tax=Didymodactylos carnosus TaxID=1234261 RepID=A0A813ZS70_9BILA|nr:unnamed protein product [Didymodactylos carnosus]CAF0904425.1 unnamed protein product [Didymodactylos carnosus]CAF3513095.1 unnamed protein product [Didymodactylos carnosus]CAF3686380.1 unnamed protein product [Didymodactylos carnosus]